MGGARELMATDFLTGVVMDARRAAFLINSSVKLCCSPAVLCFEHREDAGRFSLGFGGQVHTYSEILTVLLEGPTSHE